MIGIRSVTYHMPDAYDNHSLNTALKLSYKWAADYPFIRTQRIALTPLSEVGNLQEYVHISQLCDTSDIRWFNIPIDPWEAENREALFAFAENAIESYGRAFVNVLTFKNGKMNQDIMARSATLIKKVSRMSSNGKDNFRLGLSVNVGPNGSFFPFTYSGGKLGFSIALELTQELNKICAESVEVSIKQLQEIVLERLSMDIEVIQSIAEENARKYGVEFLGFDFSIAPIISRDGSVIPLIQRLGVYNFGKTGTMFATAYWTSILKALAQKYKSVGFSGVMYSLLEDLDLCMINNQRGVDLDDLIKVSTMCGCGVDMVPVSSDISQSELNSILAEVYAISTRLNKPLGIRILPIPYVSRTQLAYTNLSDDADFIANTKVLNLNINLLTNLENEFCFPDR